VFAPTVVVLTIGYLMLSSNFTPAVAQAQTPVASTIRDAVGCAKCEIRVAQKLKLDTDDGPGFVGVPARISRDSRGRLYLASGTFLGETKVYDANGVYLRHLTKRGSGPGEVNGGSIAQIVRGDSIYVFDSRSPRLSVFSPDYRFVRDTRVALTPFAATTLDSMNFLVAAPNTVGGVSYSLHLVDANGVIHRSFGTPSEQNKNATNLHLWRRVARSNEREVWSAPNFGDYRLERWATSGELKQVLLREAPWYTPSGPDAPAQWRPGVTPPPASILALRQDEAGRLWVLLAVARNDWKKAYEIPKAPAHMMFDGILEVIDPINRSVVARKRLGFYALGFVNEDVFSYDEDKDGRPIIAIWKVELYEPSGKGGSK
jgi:hypothetical protein